ncbi:siderophore-interacting protein [Allostreptomyces psammosilenae]|uniref:NADPH-dependent ferric siderophore reductase n=1 Tax=Allostreptomyces psammosilenae TaxID=1892865 RepID=A0A853A2G8_9ACTN|nr:siderophore-interacting protein [Allostreptomyces psammosilenae]NYI08317.1 NADPH-dependent ferric siderophore reductase [Allostreptomyces psammosilenae]
MAVTAPGPSRTTPTTVPAPATGPASTPGTARATGPAPAAGAAPAPGPVPPYRPFAVRVAAVTDVSPNLRRVTFVGPDLGRFRTAGYDERLKLLFPLPGQERPVLGDGPDWYRAWLDLPDEVRPHMRTYTTRAARPEHAEVDVDFARHGAAGPASAWAERARPGDPLVIVGPNGDCPEAVPAREFQPPPDAPWYLLAGDETALPAICGILERLPEDAVVRAFVEVPTARDACPPRVPAATSLTWLPRSAGPGSGAATRTGELLVAAVRGAELPDPGGPSGAYGVPGGAPYAWVAGEASAVREIRRHLVRERGWAKTSVTFSGYWRRGGPL